MLVDLYKIAIQILNFSNHYYYIFLNYKRALLNQFLYHYAIGKWSTVFKYKYLFVLLASASAPEVFVIVPLVGLYALL